MRQAKDAGTDRGAHDPCAEWAMTAGWVEGRPAQAPPRPTLSERDVATLETLIQNRIVPRLLLGSRTTAEPSAADMPALTPVTAEHVGEFAEIVVKRDLDAAVAYIEALRSAGATVEVLFQDLLAPTARRLGELWEEDINDFFDVTQGAGQLQQIVRQYSDAFHDEARQPVANRRALLMPLPGEQHMFGILMVGEHYRRAGWHVWGGPPRTIDEILDLVTHQWFDVVGLSVSRVDDPSGIAAVITRIRRRSLNRQVIVQIGGRAFAESPDLAGAVGADVTAIDGRQAVLQIAGMMGPSGVGVG